MPDYEMLELVLFRAIPRRRKPLARELLDRFGDFTGITAPAARLRDVKGVGEAVIVELKIIEAAAAAGPGEGAATACRFHDAPGCHTPWPIQTEQFRVLYLDRKTSSSPMRNRRRA